ncbi:MAG: methionyl-tRNA formyltransferase [Candidatus Omnitrophica bacterium]|nr:methionyl-tRNA formyltransferase [Candidatus Omnitrophota bacterium]
MNLVFFGTAPFAAHALKTLVASRHRIVLCVTQPDRPQGRGQQERPSPVKAWALEHSITVVQPERLEGAGILKKFKDCPSDLGVVVAYGQKIPAAVLNVPKLGCVNIHASLLPRHRGAAPIQWAIACGDTTTGITVIQMNERIDAGDILYQRELDIGDRETATGLERRLADLMSECLIGGLKELEKGALKARPQLERGVTYAPRLKKEDGLIHWSWTAEKVDRWVRAMQPWPGAYTWWKGKLIKILKGSSIPLPEPDEAPAKPSAAGQAGSAVKVSPEGIEVACGERAYRITELQLESGRALSASEFLNGHTLQAGERLG